MRWLVPLAALLFSTPAAAGEPTTSGGAVFKMPPSAVIIEGERVPVAWNDGDSFGFLGGKYVRQRVRLMGYNALESYGPVHQWGRWTGMELYKVTKASTQFARSRVWLAMSGLVFLYYLRFWFIYHFPKDCVPGTPYFGQAFFDFVVSWFEYAPWYLCLAASYVRFRRTRLRSPEFQIGGRDGGE